MTEEQMKGFRLDFRLFLMEQLALRTALLQHAPLQLATIAESKVALKEWLSSTQRLSDAVYGEHFQDPGLTALYADEAMAIIDGLKARIDNLADGLEKTTQ